MLRLPILASSVFHSCLCLAVLVSPTSLHCPWSVHTSCLLSHSLCHAACIRMTPLRLVLPRAVPNPCVAISLGTATRSILILPLQGLGSVVLWCLMPTSSLRWSSGRLR